MADAILLFRQKLRKRLFQGREVKHRIIPKPAAPARFLQNLAIDPSRYNRGRLAFLRNCNRTYKISRSLRTYFPAKLAK